MNSFGLHKLFGIGSICLAMSLTGCSLLERKHHMNTNSMTQEQCILAGLKAIDQFDADEGERLIKAGLKKAQAEGPNTPGVAKCLCAMAQLEESRSKRDEAIALYEQALAINDAGIGNNNSETEKTAVLGLASLYKVQGEFARVALYKLDKKQEAIYLRKLLLAQAASPADPTAIADALTLLGENCQNHGEIAKAEEYYKRSLETAPDRYTARCYADLLKALDRPQAAAKMRQDFGLPPR